MPIECPAAPAAPNPALDVQTSTVKAGAVLTRFHSKARAANVYNPNIDKKIDVEEDGARFNPFPGAPATNISTLYAADNFRAATLESVFRLVEHVPNRTYPRFDLAEQCYSELRVEVDLTVLELTNPQLRQIAVPGRHSSLEEGELIHTPPSEYRRTRTWAQFLHASLPILHGLSWRPRLGGTGLAFMFFGDRCPSSALTVISGPIDVYAGAGFWRVDEVARLSKIKIIG
jgi:hypothetical protein